MPIAQTFKLGILSRVLSYTKERKNRYFLSVVCTLLISFLSALRPYLIKFSLDRYVSPNLGLSGNIIQIAIGAFLLFIGLQLLLLVIETWIRYSLAINMASLSLEVLTNLRNDIYAKILRLKQSYFDRTPIGAFTTRTINDVEAMNQIFSEGLVPMLADILSIVLVILTMLWVDWQLSLLTLITLPLILIASHLFKISVQKSFQNVRTAVSKLNSFVQEHLNNREIIRVFGAENHELAQFTQINHAYKQANIRAISAYAIFYPSIEVIAAIGVMVLLLFSVHFQLDAPKVIFYFLAINQIFRPLRFIADRVNTLQMGMVSAQRIFAILDSQELIKPVGKLNKPLSGAISFQQVSFSYTKDKPALHNISLEIPAKTKVAFVGYSGQGKTSLVNLINRLYQHQQGRILLDGVAIEEFELAALRRQIALIPQNVFLFSGCLYKNISLDNQEISEHQVKQACKLLGIHDTIMALPGGYEYMVSERGINLSAGQRQLICMARALVQGSKILILDEATANMDAHTEELVEKAIEILGQNRTILLIAHRLSSVRNANQIFFLEAGRIVEQGTHAELLKKRGRYYKTLQK